ncbi:MAG: hypothetical protein JJE28_01000, partial [Actinomycetales bacterium]|nr:hypothetical protein [Actinomycetales bacterium]
MARNIFQPETTVNEGLFAFLDEGTTIPDTAVSGGGVTFLSSPSEALSELTLATGRQLGNSESATDSANGTSEIGNSATVRQPEAQQSAMATGNGTSEVVYTPVNIREILSPLKVEPSEVGNPVGNSATAIGNDSATRQSASRQATSQQSATGIGNWSAISSRSGVARTFQPGSDVLPPSSPKKRAEANFDALRVLATLRLEGRYATAAEQSELAQWSSWGALPQVFEKHRIEWAAEHETITQLLTPAEVDAASATTLNAHYTDPAIVEAMWGALSDVGLGEGSTVLEPGSGSGTFIGLAPVGVKMVGVELDPVTAAISSALYPAAHIRSEGFQKTVFPAGAVNAVVGNVPFGGFALHDPQFNGKRLNIHNHFISKSLQLVAPAGIVMVISSSFTMDSKGTTARDEFAKYGDFLGAVRLPNGAFRRVSGTDVMTDVLVFRRREDAEAEPAGLPFQNVIEISPALRGATVEADATATVNEYFVAQPQNVLGEFHLGTGMYNGATLEVKGDTNSALLAEQVRSRLSTILARVKDSIALSPSVGGLDVFAPGVHEPSTDVARPGTIRATTTNKVERFTLDGQWKAVTPAGGGTTGEVVALIAVKETARTLIASQRSGGDSAARDDLRATLGRQYDAYVQKFGAINRFEEVPAAKPTKAAMEKSMKASRAIWLSELPDDLPALERKNIEPDEALFEQWQKEAEETDGVRRTQTHLSIFRGDPDMGLLLALEHFDEETQDARKSRMFVEDVIGSRPRAGSAESIQDAIAISLDESRSIDVSRIAALLGVEEAAAREQMRGLVFTDPDTNDVVPAALYLSGDVRAKWVTVTARALTDTAFVENSFALAEVVPEWLVLDEINVRPGVRWIPTDMYVQFCEEVFKATPETMGEDPTTGAWDVKGPPRSKFEPSVAFSFGTNDRSPIELFASVMNNRSITIKRTVVDPVTGNESQKEDVAATIAAREKASQIVTAFTGWLGKDCLLYTSDAA